MLKSAKSKPPKKRIDWPSARAEYVNNASLTYANIGQKYTVLETTVRKRASDENWTAERIARATALVQKATEKSILDSVAELTKYNEQDLIAAKSLRALAAKKMQQVQQGTLEAKDLRALAGAVESAQRIARLALGASTENTDTRSTVILSIERMTPEARREHARTLYSQIFSMPSDPSVQ